LEAPNSVNILRWGASLGRVPSGPGLVLKRAKTASSSSGILRAKNTPSCARRSPPSSPSAPDRTTVAAAARPCTTWSWFARSPWCTAGRPPLPSLPMSTAPELDVFSCPLDGVRLVEASAGTGKTWNICGLYLRLLLERELPVESLLVVTFTKAATAELSGRIRERIVETLQVLDGGMPGPDPFVAQLLAHLAEAGHARGQLATRLRLALQTFDEAAIFTIHCFCQRALADTPFAAGLPYELELVEDDSALRLEATQDFWRREVAGGGLPALLATHLLQSGDSPAAWAEILKRHMARPCARPLWDAGTDEEGAGGVGPDASALDESDATA